MRGILEIWRGTMPADDREWVRFLSPLNARYQIPSETGRAEIKHSQAEDMKFHRTLAAANVISIQNEPPLSAEDAGADCTIIVAAHTIKIDTNEHVSYDGGSITGLAYETIYYVFADDAELDGGAVTYAASTDPLDMIALDRYRVGTVLTPEPGAAPNPGTGGGAGGGMGQIR